MKPLAQDPTAGRLAAGLLTAFFALFGWFTLWQGGVDTDDRYRKTRQPRDHYRRVLSRMPVATGENPPGGRPGGIATRCSYFGRTTVSMTWITPLEATMSVLMTLALSTITAPFMVLTVSD